MNSEQQLLVAKSILYQYIENQETGINALKRFFTDKSSPIKVLNENSLDKNIMKNTLDLLTSGAIELSTQKIYRTPTLIWNNNKIPAFFNSKLYRIKRTIFQLD